MFGLKSSIRTCSQGSISSKRFQTRETFLFCMRVCLASPVLRAGLS